MLRPRAICSYTHAARSLHPHDRNLRRNGHFDGYSIRMAEESLHRGGKPRFRREVHKLYPEQASSPATLGSTNPGAT
jgi:hypothetical protein